MARKNPAGYVRRFADQNTEDADMRRTFEMTRSLRDRYGFFHWES